MNPAPIALFAYNRPKHLQQAVDSLCRNTLAGQSDLHVFSDGPAGEEQVEAVQQVRAVLKEITGFASVTVHESSQNRGLAASVIEGVTLLCGDHERAIILEDDLVVSPHFLSYMNAALDRYRDETRVMQISGHMFPVEIDTEADACFLPFVTSWGWATWARAWAHFDPAAHGYGELVRDRRRRRQFNMNGAYDYFSMLEKQMQGRIDSWAVRWNLSVFMRDGLVLYPARTMVENRGFDGSGVHCRGDTLTGDLDPHFQPRRFPVVRADPDAFAAVTNYFRGRSSLGGRLSSLKTRLFG